MGERALPGEQPSSALDAALRRARELAGGERASEDQRVHDVSALLESRVPLALLADLWATDAPTSQEILSAEGLPDDAWWESDDTPSAADSDEAEPADGDDP